MQANCPFCKIEFPDEALPGDHPRLWPCGTCHNPVLLRREGGATEASALENANDVRRTAPEGSIGGAILDALPSAMDKLPVLPEISQRVLLMVADPDASMTDLAEVIKQDQAIALAIMKLANSAVYGGLEEIKELNGACARLGMKTIANTVQVVANNNLFITGDKRLQSFMRKLWRHSIASAHCAGEIATLTAEPRGEAMFLAALIHNIGKVVILDIITGEYSAAVAKLKVTPELLREVIDGFHPLVALHVASHWRLPPEYGLVVYSQNEPGRCPVDACLPMAHVVALSGAVATVEGFGMYEAEETFLVSHDSARYLNLSDIKLAALRVDLADKLEALFNAAGAEAP